MGIWCGAFLLLSAADHLLVILPGINAIYNRYACLNRNPFRWAEYAGAWVGGGAAARGPRGCTCVLAASTHAAGGRFGCAAALPVGSACVPAVRRRLSSPPTRLPSC